MYRRRIVHSAPLVALPFLSTGAALVAYILAGISLPLGIGAVLALTGMVAVMLRRRLPGDRRQAIAGRVARGALAGLVATMAYDFCRLLVVTLFALDLWPFDTFSRFGHLLVGDAASPAVAAAVGTAYHYANGTGFAVAYVLVVRRPGIVTGLLWAAALETFMVTLYPGWLGLPALDEFLGVSIVGHAAYGAVLGSTGRALLCRDDHVGAVGGRG